MTYQRIFSALLLLGLTCGLSACDEDAVTGSFTAYAPINYKDKEKEATVPSGEYKASLSFNSGDIHLSVKGKPGYSLTFKMASGVDTRGAFTLTAAQSGQAVDLHGNVDIRHTDLGPRSAYQNCDIAIPCGDRRGVDPACNGHDYIHYTGEHLVEWELDQVDRTIDVDLVDPVSQKKLGNYYGSDQDVNWNKTFDGECHLTGHQHP